METVLLSLHKRWWDKIRTGEKRLEIRKTFPQAISIPFRVLVYVTGGVGVCGEFICPHIYKIRTIPEVQERAGVTGRVNVQAASCLTAEQLKEYAGNQGKALRGWQIEGVKEYEAPVPLELYGVKRAPQSWQYFKGVEPYRRCAVCGKIVERMEPCPYNRTGQITCGPCCEDCYKSEPFPCSEHGQRGAGNQ